MCRILEHSGGDSMEINTWMMANGAVNQTGDLLLHNFGHHVIESLLEHGLPEHKHQIALALHANLTEYVTDRHSTFVIESALKQCSMEDQQLLRVVTCWTFSPIHEKCLLSGPLWSPR